jgi:hypothetical protein
MAWTASPPWLSTVFSLANFNPNNTFQTHERKEIIFHAMKELLPIVNDGRGLFMDAVEAATAPVSKDIASDV